MIGAGKQARGKGRAEGFRLPEDPATRLCSFVHLLSRWFALFLRCEALVAANRVEKIARKPLQLQALAN